jgi:serine/threonine protein kinase
MNFGRYEIERELGRGSMGIVYQAHDPRLDRRVALKVLKADLVGSETFVQRFLKEARAVARLTHPNIVSIYDVDEDQGTIYIAMELLAGESLDKLIRKRKFSEKEIVLFGIQTAQILDYAYQRGIIHRDIKPGNIVLDPNGQIKITDFGVARIEDPSAGHPRLHVP